MICELYTNPSANGRPETVGVKELAIQIFPLCNVFNRCIKLHHTASKGCYVLSLQTKAMCFIYMLSACIQPHKPKTYLHCSPKTCSTLKGLHTKPYLQHSFINLTFTILLMIPKHNQTAFVALYIVASFIYTAYHCEIPCGPFFYFPSCIFNIYQYVHARLHNVYTVCSISNTLLQLTMDLTDADHTIFTIKNS